MQYRSLGQSGLRVSVIGLGGNPFGNTADAAQSLDVIEAALDAGVNFLDTADVYGTSEEIIGKAVRGRRDDVILATKVGGISSQERNNGRLSRRQIMAHAEESLRRLGTDYIDLFQAHRPDSQTPIEESLRAFEDLVSQGKVRYLGCSNFRSWELVRALWLQDRRGWSPWISLQQSWNLVDGITVDGVPDPDLPSVAREFGLGIIPFFPLASGVLTGKYARGEEPPAGTRMAEVGYARKHLTDTMLAAVERLRPWAEGRGHTLAELAIAWLLAHAETATVIAGARHPDQLRQNVRAADWVLTPAEREEIEALTRPVDSAGQTAGT
jgi:aryl-alcohol dehydrogenase-like predicted oxidoreductase